MNDRRGHLLLLAPYLFGLAVLVFFPAVVTFGLALTEYDLIRSPRFVGLDNSASCGAIPSSRARSRTRSTLRRSVCRFACSRRLGSRSSSTFASAA